MMESGDNQIIEQTLWFVANLVGESLELRDKVLAGVNLVSLIGDIVRKN